MQKQDRREGEQEIDRLAGFEIPIAISDRTLERMHLPARWDNCELLLRAFNERCVEYLRIGSMAKSYYRPLHSVGDMDLLYNPEPENAKKVGDALYYVNYTLLSRTDFIDYTKLTSHGLQIRINDHIDADILTPLHGFSFRNAFCRSIAIEVAAGIPVRIASEHDLEILDSLRDARERDERTS